LVLPSKVKTNTSGRAVYGTGLWPLPCRECSYKCRQGQGCLARVSVVCCQVQVSVACWPLVRRTPTECGVSEYDCKALKMRRHWPTGGLLSHRGGGIKVRSILHPQQCM